MHTDRKPRLGILWGAVGRTLGRLQVNHTRWICSDTKRKLLKKRSWLGLAAIPCGNWLLARRRVPASMLIGQDWYQWESALYKLLHNETVEMTSSHWLSLPELPGQPLASLLTDASCSPQKKMDYIYQAAAGLRELHAYTIPVREHGQTLLSHGDATVQNVLLDLHTGRVYWIDFDTRHALHTPHTGRQADDLRALCFSAGSLMSPTHIADAVCTALKGYGNAESLRLLKCWSRESWLDTDLYHRAHASLGVDRHAQVQAFLTLLS